MTHYRKTYEVTGYVVGEKGFALCLDCAGVYAKGEGIPFERTDMIEHDSLSPIFLGDEWDTEPTCDVCHTEIECSVLMPEVQVWFVHMGLEGLYLPNYSAAYATESEAIEAARDEWELALDNLAWADLNPEDDGIDTEFDPEAGSWAISQHEHVYITSDFVRLNNGQTLEQWLEEYGNG